MKSFDLFRHTLTPFFIHAEGYTGGRLLLQDGKIVQNIHHKTGICKRTRDLRLRNLFIMIRKILI